MDERELAGHILAVVDQMAYSNSVARILGIHLAVGGRYVFDSQRLHHTFSEAARGTVAEGAQLFVKVLPVHHHCQGCGSNFEGSANDCPCPECGHPHTEMRGGQEVRLLDVDLEDNAA